MNSRAGHAGPLADAIRAAIGRHPNGAIPFRDYMELCLYHEPYGYYSKEKIKVGKEGDFYTSSSVGTIMGDVLAGFIVRTAESSGREGPVRVAEWGGGNGRLARHILDAVGERFPSFYERLVYTMVEISPFHRKLQKEALHSHPNVRFATPDEWLADEASDHDLVLSNELLDAFPIHRVERKDGELYEWHVRWDEEAERFVKRLLPLEKNGTAANYLLREGIALREGQSAEANPEAADWIRRIGSRLSRGTLLTIDYGDEAGELYAPHRMQGTFLCYRNHVAFDDPFAYPGDQDMTSHVNFTACIRAGEDVGLTDWSLRTQKRFLLDEGVLGLLAEHDGTDPFSPAARRNRAIRQLLLTDQMSELFKVLVQTKKR